MSDQDPLKGSFNNQLGKYHLPIEKLAAGVSIHDSEATATEKLLRHGGNENYGTTSGAGLAAFVGILVSGTYFSIKNSFRPFKEATGISVFIYLPVAIALYVLAFHFAGFANTRITATTNENNPQSFLYNGFLSQRTPDLDFFGRPVRYHNNPQESLARADLLKIYEGTLTEHDISRMQTNNSIYRDPSISQMRKVAVKKGLGDQFDQQTISYLNETFRKDPNYKNANFVIEKKNWPRSEYNPRTHTDIKTTYLDVTYYME